jgi:hypothetical protein
MDQIGCGFIPTYDVLPESIFPQSDVKSFLIPFDSCLFHSSEGVSFTVVWPIREVKSDEPLLCYSLNKSLISRLALLNVVDCEPFISAEDYHDTFEDTPISTAGDEVEMSEEEFGNIMDPHHLSFPPSLSIEHSRQTIDSLAIFFHSTQYSVELIRNMLSLSAEERVDELTTHRSVMYERLRTHLISLNELSPGDGIFLQKSFQSIVIISLCCLGITLPMKYVVECFGSELTISLIRLGIFFYRECESSYTPLAAFTHFEMPGSVSSIVQILPIESQTQTIYIMADFPDQIPLSLPVPTYSDLCLLPSLSYEAYFEPIKCSEFNSSQVLQGLPATEFEGNGVDVFCGCGIRGIAALTTKIIQKMTFIEYNHRAVRFLRFNLWFNSISFDRVRIIFGDVEDIFANLKAHSETNSFQPFHVVLGQLPSLP